MSSLWPSLSRTVSRWGFSAIAWVILIGVVAGQQVPLGAQPAPVAMPPTIPPSAVTPMGAPPPAVNPYAPPPEMYGAAPQQQGPQNVMIILDMSSSMEEKLPTGEMKMDAAKRAIQEVLRQIPPNVAVGFRVYGNSTSGFSACRATKKLVPLGVNNRDWIARELVRLQPTGATPITYTITRSIEEDFIGAMGTKAIILISDGEETCDGDPCGVTVAMVRRGVDVKIDVIGFGLYDMSAVRQLRCVALSTFGKMYQADTAADLARRMTESMRIQTDVQGTVLIPGASNGRPMAPPQAQPNGVMYPVYPSPRQQPPGQPAGRVNPYGGSNSGG